MQTAIDIALAAAAVAIGTALGYVVVTVLSTALDVIVNDQRLTRLQETRGDQVYIVEKIYDCGERWYRTAVRTLDGKLIMAEDRLPSFKAPMRSPLDIRFQFWVSHLLGQI